MNKNGSFAIETAVVFPLFLILLVVLIIILAKTILYEKNDPVDFMDKIMTVDSIKRKVSILDEVLE